MLEPYADSVAASTMSKAARPRSKSVKAAVAALVAVAVSWYGVGLIVRLLVIQASDQGRITVAQERLKWSARLRFWDSEVLAMRAQCARRRVDHEAWSKITGDWSQRWPRDRRLAVEKELMRVQMGGLRFDAQAQLNSLLQAGGETNDVAAVFACGFIVRQDFEQTEKILAAWEPNGKRPFDADYYRAIAARSQGNRDEAIQLLQSVIQSCSAHELAHETLGQLLLEARQPDAGLGHYLIVLRDSPSSISSRVGAAQCLRELGQWQAAKEILSNNVDSKSPSVIQELAQIDLELGNYQAADTRFRQVEDPVKNGYEGRMAVAMAKSLTGDHQAARQLMDQDVDLESLQKQLRDLQVRVRLYPDDFESATQLKLVKEQILQARK